MIAFWQRQFTAKTTLRQIIFDVVAGILLPILCLVFDPIVFRGSGLLAECRALAYIAIGFGVLTLTLWLALGAQIKQWVSIIAGILLFGALFAFAIGVILLPLSLLELRVVVGVFGFAPFFTSFVFLRNWFRAFRQADAQVGSVSSQWKDYLRKGLGVVVPIVLFLVVVRIPWLEASLWKTTSQERGLERIMKAAIRGDERYVIDEEGIERSNVLPAVAVSRPAWNTLIAHSSGLAEATIAITTAIDPGDNISSEIRIDCASSTIHCSSRDGNIGNWHFYVYTCTVAAGSW